MKIQMLTRTLACLLILGICGLAILPHNDTQDALASGSGSNCLDEVANCLEAVAEALRDCLGNGSGNCVSSAVDAAQACYDAYSACMP